MCVYIDWCDRRGPRPIFTTCTTITTAFEPFGPAALYHTHYFVGKAWQQQQKNMAAHIAEAKMIKAYQDCKYGVLNIEGRHSAERAAESKRPKKWRFLLTSGVGRVLRLERDAWSMAEWLGQAKKRVRLLAWSWPYIPLWPKLPKYKNRLCINIEFKRTLQFGMTKCLVSHDQVNRSIRAVSYRILFSPPNIYILLYELAGHDS